MNPMLKYTLARFGIFAVCLALALLVLPRDMNLFLKVLIALLVSMIASFFLLRRWADDLADRMNTNLRRRKEQKDRLRAALAGEDDPSEDDKRA